MKNTLLICIHLAMSVLISSQIIGQEETPNADISYSITAIEELKSVNVEFSYLDKLGFLWVVSGNTILRHDGSELEVISGKFGFNPNDRVIKIIEDDKKNKYFLFRSRHYFGYMPFGSFEVKNIPVSISDKIRDIYTDNSETTILVDRNDSVGFFAFDTPESNPKYLFDAPIKNKSQQSKILHHGSFYFLLNDVFLSIYNENGTPLKIHEIKVSDKNYFYDSNPTIVKDKIGNVYFTVYNSGKILKSNRSSNYSTIEVIDIPNTSHVIEGLWKDDHDQLIGVWKDVDGFTSVVNIIKMGDEVSYSNLILPERTVSNINSYNFSDFIIVCGYYGSSIIYRNPPMFKKFVSNPLTQNNYLEDGISIRGIAGDDDHIYALREIKNIYKYDKVNNLLEKKYIVNTAGDTIQFRCARNASFFDDQIWFSSCSENDDNYLICYDIATDSSIIFDAPGRIQSLTKNQIGTGFILPLSRENNKSQLYFFSLETNQFELISQFSSNQNVEYTFIKNTSEALFIGTKSGLIIVDPILFHNSSKYKNLQQYLASAYINFIDVFDDNIIIGTMDRGMIIRNNVNNEIKEINSGSGLLSNGICAVLKDYKNRYWVSTFNGIYVLNNSFEIIYSFFENDGINHNEFNRFSYYNDNNHLYFGGVNGFLQINLDMVSEIESELLPIYLSKLTYDDIKDGKTIIEYFNGDNPEINLKPQQNNLKLKFTSPSLWSQNYIITVDNGMGSEWMLMDKNKSLDLSGLKPGNYRLSTCLKHFKEKNKNVESTLTQKITIDQYYYNTLWFKFLLASVLLSMIIMYVANKRKEKREINNIRERIATDLHDDLGSILTGIASRAEVSIIRSDNDKHNKDFNFFLNNSNKALELMRDAIWSINPENDNLNILVDRMKDFAYNSLNHKDIKIEFDIDIDEDKKITNPLWRKELYMIYKEAITNILKHSEATRVKITFTQSRNEFLLQITNDGVRTNTNGNGLGMGLKNMKRRSKNLNGSIEFSNGTQDFKVLFKGNIANL